MRTLLLTVLLFVAIACTSNKEEANEYYERFSAIIVPYKEGTERILNEMQSMLQKQMRASGNFKLSPEDSSTQQAQIKQFELLAEKTIDELESLDDLPKSDLKTSGIEYVKTSSDAVLGAFREIAIPMQQAKGLGQKALDSLSDKYSNDLVESNEEFAARQIEFLKEFEVISIERE